MRNVNIYTLSLYVFLISIALFRLPYIYLFPGVTNPFLTSQALARILLITSLFLGLLLARKSIKFSEDGQQINLVLLAFFATSSLSVLYAQNLDAFITRYKDFVIGMLAFYTFYLFKREEKKIVLSFIVTMPIMIIYQFLLLYGGGIASFITPFIYQRHLDILSYNLDRGRIYIDTYDEAFIPMVFVVFKFKSKVQIIVALLLVSSLSFLAFISSFRTRIGMLAIGLLGSFAVFNRKLSQRIIFLFFALAILGIIASLISGYTTGSRFYERFLLSDQQDIATITSRFDQINIALYMGFVSPFGVGLGNYYDNLPSNKIKSLTALAAAEISAREYIHNNFATVIAESGYIAFFLYLLLLIKFMQMDRRIMKENDYYKRSFVVAFWSLFFYGFFNPPIPISYQVLFWGMRGLLV